MRLRIDTSTVKFRIGGVARPRMESRANQVQKMTPDGRPIWAVRLFAIDTQAGTTEQLWVEVAGEQPQLIVDEVAAVQGLVYAPWVNNKNEIVRAFRADSITIDAAARRTAA